MIYRSLWVGLFWVLIVSFNKTLTKDLEICLCCSLERQGSACCDRSDGWSCVCREDSWDPTANSVWSNHSLIHLLHRFARGSVPCGCSCWPRHAAMNKTDTSHCVDRSNVQWAHHSRNIVGPLVSLFSLSFLCSGWDKGYSLWEK